MKRLLPVVLATLCFFVGQIKAQNCVDASQIDESFNCIALFEPVCGCDGVTYPNECFAIYYGGVQSFVMGACESSQTSETGESEEVIPEETADCPDLIANFTFERVSVGVNFSANLPYVTENYCFYNASIGDIDYYEWTFFGISTSDEENPCDIPFPMVVDGYLSKPYEVCLQIYDAQGCFDTACALVTAAEDYSEIEGVIPSTDSGETEEVEEEEIVIDDETETTDNAVVDSVIIVNDTIVDITIDDFYPSTNNGEEIVEITSENTTTNNTTTNCNFFPNTYCTAPQTPVEICANLCNGYDIEDAYTTYNCGIQFLANGCIRYTPLPQMPPLDSLVVTFCQNGANCVTQNALINIGDCTVTENPDTEPTNCNIFEQTYCTAPQTPVEICTNLCDGFFIDYVYSTYNCSVQNIGNNCLRYTPLPQMPPSDSLVVTVCQIGNVNCQILTAYIAIGDCEETPEPCNDNYFTEEYCTEPQTVIELCPVLCDDYEITSAHTTYNCSVSILENDCIRYLPLPGYQNLTDTVNVTVCPTGTNNNCQTINAQVFVGECSTTDDAGTDTATTDDSGTDTATTDDAGTDTATTDDAGTDTATTDGTSDGGNTDNTTPSECNIETMSACTGVAMPLSICPDICTNYYIDEVTPSFPCNIQIINNNQCFVYTPLPSAVIGSIDQVHYTVCQAGGINCSTAIIYIEANNNCYGTDDATTDNSGTDDSSTDNAGTDNATTDDSSTDNAGTDDSGTDNGSTDDSSTTTCNTFDDALCTELMTPLDFCIDLCEGYFIEHTLSTYFCSMQTLSSNCIRYSPLPGYFGLDLVVLTICDENLENCFTLNIPIQVGECDSYDGTTDGSGTDATTDGSGTDATTDGSGTDATTDGSGTDSTTDGASDDSTTEIPPCNLKPTTDCTAPMEVIEVCPYICSGYYITQADALIAPNVLIADDGKCLIYTPAIGFTFGVDLIGYTICTEDGTQCYDSTINIEINQACGTPSTDDSGTDATTDDSGTDATTDDAGTDTTTDDSGTDTTTDDSGTDATTDDSGTDATTDDAGTDTTTDDAGTDTTTDDSGTDATTDGSGTDTGSTDDSTTTPCNTFNDALCTELMTPIDFCLDLCEGYQIEKAVTTYHCSVQIIEENCIRYMPLPGYVGSDTIQLTICNPVITQCITMMVDVQVGDCDNFDDSGTDATTDGSGTDATTDGSGTDETGTDDGSTDDVTPEPCNIAIAHYCTAPLTAIEICPNLCPNYYVANVETLMPCDVNISDDFQCFYYAPIPQFVAGVDELTLTICYAGGINCFTAYASLEINEACGIPPAENSNPVANPDYYDVQCGSSVFNLLENDSDPNSDPISICNVGQPLYGMVFLQGTKVMYVPDSDFSGTDVFTYEICDGYGGSATASVFIEVSNGSNTSSISIINDYYTAVGNVSMLISPLENDASTEGEINLCNIGTSPNATITFSGNQITYKANKDFTGFEYFTYEVCEADGCGSATGIVYILIEAPCENTLEVYCTDIITPITICPTYCAFENGEAYTINVNQTCDLVPLDNNCFQYTPYPDVIDEIVMLTVDGCDENGNCETQNIQIYVGQGALGVMEAVPMCIADKIAATLAEAPWNPRAKVYSGTYNGEKAYYFTADCCDQFTTLYNQDCQVICKPDGGFTGMGDGNCTNFDLETFELIWQDNRL